MRKHLFSALLSTFFVVLLADSSGADAEHWVDTVFVHIEEDFLYPPLNEDRNYTGGLVLGVGGRLVERLYVTKPLELLTSSSASFFDLVPRGWTHSGLQLGGSAFTPDNIKSRVPVIGDRPYASIIAVTVSHQRIADDLQSALTSEYSIARIGTRAPGNVQNWIHRNMEITQAAGWDNQVSNGGEFTGRFSMDYRRVLWHRPTPLSTSKWVDITGALGFELGYYTTMHSSGTLRIGRISGMPRGKQLGGSINKIAPNLGEEPEQQPARSAPWELYLYGDFGGRAVAYNALLQGQFGPNVYSVSSGEVSPAILEYEAGLHFRYGNWLYTLTPIAGRTAEFETAGRNHVWGAFTVAWSLVH